MLFLPFARILFLFLMFNLRGVLDGRFASRWWGKLRDGARVFFNILFYPLGFLEEIFLTLHSDLIPEILFHFLQLLIKLSLHIAHILLLLLHLAGQIINTLTQRNGNPSLQLHRNLTNNLLLHFLHLNGKIILDRMLFIPQYTNIGSYINMPLVWLFYEIVYLLEVPLYFILDQVDRDEVLFTQNLGYWHKIIIVRLDILYLSNPSSTYYILIVLFYLYFQSVCVWSNCVLFLILKYESVRV